MDAKEAGGTPQCREELQGTACHLASHAATSGGLARVVRGSNLLQIWLHAPNLPGVLGDGAVAGKFATAGDVVDDLLGPGFGVLNTENV